MNNKGLTHNRNGIRQALVVVFTYSLKSRILVFLHIYGMIEYVYYINRLERLPVYR